MSATPANEYDAVVEFLAAESAIAGPLAGVRLAVKELMDVRGSVTTAGSDIAFASGPAGTDSAPVAALRRAGAVPVMRTRTHEWAYGITGRHPTRSSAVNPHDPSRIAGGSSSGSAVTVAAGMVDLALGTDTAGSIRIPAAFCGVIGMKPTWGTVSLDGVVPLAPGFDTVGVLSRTPAILRSALTALGVPLEEPVAQVRVGRLEDPTLPVLPGDLAAPVDRALELLGADTVVRPPASTVLRALFNAVQPLEALAVHRDRLGSWPSRRHDYGADVAGRLAASETLPAVPPELRREREALRESYLAALGGVDVLALPVTACPPPGIDDPDHVTVDGHRTPLRELVLPFTVPASLFGLPAASVPIGFDDQGLPVGLQLLSRPGNEAAILETIGALVADIG